MLPPRPGSQHHFCLQVEQLSSLQSLLSHISSSWLPASLGGGLPYCHQAWLHFRMVSALGGAQSGYAGSLASRGETWQGIQIQAGQ